MKFKDILYYKGTRIKIIFAATPTNSMPSKEYLEERIPAEWAKLDRILKRLGDFGKVKNKQQFRSVGDGLYEAKAGIRRLVGYFVPNHFVLTHGFNKRGGGKSANRFPSKERKRALNIKLDFEPLFKNMIKGMGHGHKK